MTTKQKDELIAELREKLELRNEIIDYQRSLIEVMKEKFRKRKDNFWKRLMT